MINIYELKAIQNSERFSAGKSQVLPGRSFPGFRQESGTDTSNKLPPKFPLQGVSGGKQTL
jgi:hypothetical protein